MSEILDELFEEVKNQYSWIQWVWSVPLNGDACWAMFGLGKDGRGVVVAPPHTVTFSEPHLSDKAVEFVLREFIKKAKED